MKFLFLDFETFSTEPISRGLDIYFRAAEFLLAQWAIGPGKVQLHDFYEDPIFPQELIDLLLDPSVTIVAHNAQFERYAIKYLLGIDIPAERFFCTMACALAHSLPAGLGLLSLVLGVTAKIDGKNHIHLFCKPQRGKVKRWTNENSPKEWEEFKVYACGDVITGREVYHALPKRNFVGEHRRLWAEDNRINERGFHVDRELAEAAVELLDADKARLDGRTQELTNGELRSANQRDKLLLLLIRDYGILLESMQAEQLNEALDDDRLPEPVKELIRVRIATAMASTSKFKKLLICAGPDDRLRNTLQYAGASRTGRWSGRIFQPQNLRRPTMKQADIDEVTRLFVARDTDMITMYADLREAASNMMRGLIVAGPGKKLVVSDWSGIESRVLAWLAGEQWVLDVSSAADHDPKNNKDLYVHTVAKAYGMALDDIDSYLRQQGKGMVLSLGYEGGVKAFLSIAAAYGLDIEELGRKGPDILPSEHLARAADVYDWAVKKDKTFGLARPEYIACEAIKLAYREANSAIRDVWAAYRDAATLCIQYPGEKVVAGRCLFQRKGNWLMIEMPSGRTLMYPSPKVSPRGELSYMGQANKQWVRIKTYGGKIAENITQAVSNDILRVALLASVDDGFTPVLHVHDELVCEQDEDDDYHTLARLDGHMRRGLSWSKGLPLHTAGWEGTRYRK
jgi:DNA polymerase